MRRTFYAQIERRSFHTASGMMSGFCRGGWAAVVGFESGPSCR
jgi:hypothetical protein